MTGILSRVCAAAAWIAEISSCHLSGVSARSFTFRSAPTPYSTRAFRSLSGLMCSSASEPSVTIPISSCVIWPTFSFTLMWARRSRMRCASADASGGSGARCCSRKVWLSRSEDGTGACPPALGGSASRQAIAKARRRITSPGRRLEDQFHAELGLPRIAGSRRLAEVAGQRVTRDLGGRRRVTGIVLDRHRVHRRDQILRQEVGPVEHVEDLELHLDLETRRRFHGLVEREVGLQQARAA